MIETSAKPDQLMSVLEASRVLRMSEQMVRRLLRDQTVKGQQVGRTWIVDSESIRKHAASLGFVGSTSSSATSIDKSDDGALKVLSFFSGAMGLDLGLEAAGMKTLLACEFDKACRQTIQQNRPDLPLLGDIWKYSADEIRTLAGLSENDEIDVMAGGPPCQAFSTAGSRRGFDDIRGNVFLHYIALIGELRPRYAVIENVRGLLSAPLKHRPHNERGSDFPPLTDEEQPGGALAYIVGLLELQGYSVSFNLYNAANYGSAQVRERVVLICSREGGRVPFLPPSHSNIPEYELSPWRTFREVAAGLDEEASHHLEFPESRLKYFRQLREGQYWKHLPEDVQKVAMGKSYYSGGGKTGFYRRLAWDKPSPTVVTHPAMPATDLAHPEEDRPLSIEEYKRIQDFPDEWHLAGSLKDQYKQIGNAVPVQLGTAIGRAIIAHSKGQSEADIEGFPYSRYRGTSDGHLARKTAKEIRALYSRLATD